MPYPPTRPEKLMENLLRYQREARANEGFKNMPPPRDYKQPRFFRKYPIEVQDKCWEHYNSLCIKHKAKLQGNNRYKRILVATATRLALDELGITQISRKGFHRLRIINSIKVRLNLRDKNPNNRRIKGYAPQDSSLQESKLP